MIKSYNIPHSISLLKANVKIYKHELKQVAMKRVQWNTEINKLENKKDIETIKYLDRKLLGRIK